MLWGDYLGTKDARVRVGLDMQKVTQRNVEGSTPCWTDVHPQSPLGWNSADGPRGGSQNAVGYGALEWRRRRRMPEYFLGRGAIDNAGVKGLLGVVNGGRGVVHGLIDEASQV